MPCSGEHMNPRWDERQRKREANLIMYVEAELGRVSPEWVRSEAANMYANDERLTPYLCELMNSLAPAAVDRVVYNARNKTARDLADWWEHHQSVDAIRAAREADAAATKRTQARAMAKLTPEEKAALGFHND